MKKLFILLLSFTAALTNAGAEEVCDIVNGSVLIAQDDKYTFLGKIASAYDLNSIFNEYGPYGGEYHQQSVWNQHATFGSEYSTYSPHNPYTLTPPMLIKNKKVIGYLTANKTVQPSIAPNLLKALCKDDL
jgi:hypothetical protein